MRNHLSLSPVRVFQGLCLAFISVVVSQVAVLFFLGDSFGIQSQSGSVSSVFGFHFYEGVLSLFQTNSTLAIMSGVCFVLVFVMVFGLGARFLGGKFTPKQGGTYGSATWASASDVQAAGLLSGKGVVLGRDMHGRVLTHDGPEHVAVIAPSRSGKGVGTVIPTLLNWPGSCVVMDLKAENWENTSGFRKQFSHVLYFDPGSEKSVRFNPLLEVRKGLFEIRDVQTIADIVMDPGGGEGKNDHWARTGHQLLTAAILHCLYDSEEESSLAGVTRFLSEPSRSFEQTLEYMMTFPHLDSGPHDVVARSARDMLNKAPNERSGVLSTALSYLTIYRDPLIARNTSASDFRISDLMQSESPVSLYICLPPGELDRLKPLIRLLLSQICRRLTENHSDPDNKHRLLLLIDEFPTLGRLDFFQTAIGFVAGYGIKCMLIMQCINDLYKSYGRETSILDNCHVRVLHAPNTLDTANLISNMVGKSTVKSHNKSFSTGKVGLFPSVSRSENETGRPLLTPDEVMKLPAKDQIIFMAGKRPIYSRKIFYPAEKEFTVRHLKAPFLPTSGVYPFRPAPKRHDWELSEKDEAIIRKKALEKAEEKLKALQAAHSPEKPVDVFAPVTAELDPDAVFDQLIQTGKIY